MTHLYRTECRHCGTQLGYLDHCCTNPRCGEDSNRCPECGTVRGWFGWTSAAESCSSCRGVLESVARLVPYASNPQRRLRRIKRWMAKCSKVPGVRLPDQELVHSFTGESGFDSWDDRIERLRVLMAAELEWACKTAMTAVGGEW